MPSTQNTGYYPYREAFINLTAPLGTTGVNQPISNVRNLLMVAEGPAQNSLKSLNTRVLFGGLPTYLAGTPTYNLKSRFCLPDSLMIPMLSGAVFGTLSQPVDYAVYHQILGRQQKLYENLIQVIRRLHKTGVLTSICYANSSLMLFGLGPIFNAQTGKYHHPFVSALACGCIGALGTIVIHPIDSVRLRYQKDYRQLQYRSIQDTVVKIYRESGVGGFYRLWMMRMVSSYAASFFYALIRSYGHRYNNRSSN